MRRNSFKLFAGIAVSLLILTLLGVVLIHSFLTPDYDPYNDKANSYNNDNNLNEYSRSDETTVYDDEYNRNYNDTYNQNRTYNSYSDDPDTQDGLTFGDIIRHLFIFFTVAIAAIILDRLFGHRFLRFIRRRF